MFRRLIVPSRVLSNNILKNLPTRHLCEFKPQKEMFEMKIIFPQEKYKEMLEFVRKQDLQVAINKIENRNDIKRDQESDAKDYIIVAFASLSFLCLINCFAN